MTLPQSALQRAARLVPPDPLLSVVMPVFNERATIEEIIRRVLAVKLEDLSVGKLGFIANHRLWTDEQGEAAKRVLAQAAEQGLRTVRISFGDQHGILRGKTLTARELPHVLRNGIDFPSDILCFDTANDPAFLVFDAGGGFGLPEMTGIPDVILVPDPLSFRVLPWVPKTGWLLADMYFDTGRPVPFSTRQVMRDALDALQKRGMDYVAGLEVEFYITKLEDPMLLPEQAGRPPDPPRVSLVAHGFRLFTPTGNESAIVSFYIDKGAAQAREALDKAGVQVSFREKDTQIRVSPALFNTRGDIQRFFDTATAPTLSQSAYLYTPRGRVDLLKYFPAGGEATGARFIFPRVLNGQPPLQPGDKQMRFEVYVPPINNTVRVGFDPRKMVFQGKLDY